MDYKMKKLRKEPQKLNSEEAKIKRKSALFLAPSMIDVSLFFVLPFLVVIFIKLSLEILKRNRLQRNRC